MCDIDARYAREGTKIVAVIPTRRRYREKTTYRVGCNVRRLIFAGNRRCALNHYELFTAL